MSFVTFAHAIDDVVLVVVCFATKSSGAAFSVAAFSWSVVLRPAL